MPNPVRDYNSQYLIMTELKVFEQNRKRNMNFKQFIHRFKIQKLYKYNKNK